MANVMTKSFAVAFSEWDRRYRENPEEFWNTVEHLLGSTPSSYGEAAGAYFTALLDEMAGGEPWMEIGGKSK